MGRVWIARWSRFWPSVVVVGVDDRRLARHGDGFLQGGEGEGGVERGVAVEADVDVLDGAGGEAREVERDRVRPGRKQGQPIHTRGIGRDRAYALQRGAARLHGDAGQDASRGVGHVAHDAAGGLGPDERRQGEGEGQDQDDRPGCTHGDLLWRLLRAKDARRRYHSRTRRRSRSAPVVDVAPQLRLGGVEGERAREGPPRARAVAEAQAGQAHGRMRDRVAGLSARGHFEVVEGGTAPARVEARTAAQQAQRGILGARGSPRAARGPGRPPRLRRRRGRARARAAAPPPRSSRRGRRAAARPRERARRRPRAGR